MTGQPFRLPDGGVDLDRGRPLAFRFDGRDYRGYAGDTLASALLANGVRLIGRSFKYHRPRGIVGAGVEEANALVQLGSGARSTPNVRATEVELYEGLEARPVNCWPSLRFDLGAVSGWFGRFLPAGFYYKTFMWPNWHWYEGAIRRAAGLGRLSAADDPDRYETRHAQCDLLVIGAGPAGIAAARAGAADGVRVMLVEQDAQVGGSLRVDPAMIDDRPGRQWAEDEVLALTGTGVTVLTRTTATGYFDHDAVTLLERTGDEAECAADKHRPRFRLWQVRARRVILATGAIERPLVFPGNDRPGVMLASAIRHYAVRHGVVPGRRVLVFTNNDSAYRTATMLRERGVVIAAVIDGRPKVRSALLEAMATAGIPVVQGGVIVATRGRHALRGSTVRHADGCEEVVACDAVAMSGGFTPTVHLFAQSGGALRFDADLSAFVPGASVATATSVGAAAGTSSLATALEEGHCAGGEDSAQAAVPATIVVPDDAPVVPVWQVRGTGKAFVDFQNDVTADDIALSAREGFRSVEHLKRYTTLGMAPDQGKTSNVNALALMAAETGRSIAETGTTRYRFPFTPMPIGSFAGLARGELFRPRRYLPAHDRHVAAGGLFEDYGGWERPGAYPRAGESLENATRREALAVRRAAGLFEGSPLGKIEVAGPDSATFLDRIYANTMSTLSVGKVRYGLMLSELGTIMDDGVAARLAEDRFLVGTSSGAADRIALWLEEWLQCEWPDLDVVILPVTSAWGVLTLTGPAARAILQAAGSDIDLSPGAFTHMSWREGRIAGLPVRVMRVSYTGEVSYEINVATPDTPLLWDRLTAAGAAYGIEPVGIEAWMLLRTEKGYLHVGADTDGATTPLDVGWPQVLRKKSDYIGRRSLTLPAQRRPDRLGLVGFEAFDGIEPLPIGAHVVTQGDSAIVSEGYITSSGFSDTLGRGVAIGMIRGGTARLGQPVVLRTAAGERRARIAPIAAYDPEGARLRD